MENASKALIVTLLARYILNALNLNSDVAYICALACVIGHCYPIFAGFKGGKAVSPYVTAQNKYAEQILKCSSKLGLATTDRLKLVVPQADEGPENKYLKYAK